jgi:erythromycin esterase-like protein
MWRNTEVVGFVEWLRQYNGARDAGAPEVGFYGMDLYSLYTSVEAVLGYLEQIDTEAAARARARYSCFDHTGVDAQAYGYAATLGLAPSCEDEVARQLTELRQRALDYMHRDGQVAEDDFFYAEQNARLVKNAEQYYRSMFRGRVSSWNLRDQHMAETLESLVRHLERRHSPAKVVVWAHNSHLGDARATEMGDMGELNVGQLVREKYGPESVLVGFSTYTGTVTAASDWGAPAEVKRVRPGLPGSFEELFHQQDLPDFLLPLREVSSAGLLRQTRLQRAIGVIYLPQTERQSHYFHARLPNQFDAVLHFDTTRALRPLDRSPHWDDTELPETYPTGL